MISKTIGFRGLADIFRHTHISVPSRNPSAKHGSNSSLIPPQEKARVSALYQQTIGMLAHSAAKAEAEEVRCFWRVDGCGNSWEICFFYQFLVFFNICSIIYLFLNYFSIIFLNCYLFIYLFIMFFFLNVVLHTRVCEMVYTVYIFSFFHFALQKGHPLQRRCMMRLN